MLMREIKGLSGLNWIASLYQERTYSFNAARYASTHSRPLYFGLSEEKLIGGSVWIWFSKEKLNGLDFKRKVEWFGFQKKSWMVWISFESSLSNPHPLISSPSPTWRPSLSPLYQLNPSEWIIESVVSETIKVESRKVETHGRIEHGGHVEDQLALLLAASQPHSTVHPGVEGKTCIVRYADDISIYII